MSEYVTLSCPSCSGTPAITRGIDRFACPYCGVEHIAKRADGLVSLAPVVAELQQVRTGVDRTASELALPKLTAELAALEEEKGQLASKMPVRFSWQTVLGQFLLAVVIALVTVPAMPSGTNPGVAFIVGAVVFLLLLSIHLYRCRRANPEEARQIQEASAGLDEQIRLKQGEIARHRAIAPVRIRVGKPERAAISRLEKEIAQLQEKRRSSSKQMNVYWLIAISLGLIACVISAISVVAESELFMVSLIAGAGLCAFLVFLGFRENDLRASAVAGEIGQKQPELAKYKEILSRGE